MKRIMIAFLLTAMAVPLITLISCQGGPKVNYLDETMADRDARMQWWREARFGMFIHWGLYAIPAGEYKGERAQGIGEWIQATLNIPKEEYELFANEFNPVKYDPEAWVKLAKDAGMKYIVITSKHHDGFCLWDSKKTQWDVVDATPYGKDLLKPLSDACRKHGLVFCTYHSILDWHHPAQYVDPDAANPRAGHARNAIHPEKKEAFVKYLKGQLKEIVTGLDPGVMWFDGEWVEWWTEEDGKDLYNYVRNLKPSIIINNRVGKGRKGMEGMSKGPEYVGDFGTPEQQIPDTGMPGVDWESCMTMNDTWGYKYFDDNWKSAETLVRNLIDIASKGGNYLLNVGPTAEGLIPDPSVERLQAIGDWMGMYGEALYGTSASPFEKPAWGRYTQKDGKIYAHVFDWPKNERLEVPLAAEKIQKAYLLSDPSMKGLKLRAREEGVQIELPDRAPDAIASVVVIEKK